MPRRNHADVEADVARTCMMCSGGYVAMVNGTLGCALDPPKTECVLIKLVAAVKAECLLPLNQRAMVRRASKRWISAHRAVEGDLDLLDPIPAVNPTS